MEKAFFTSPDLHQKNAEAGLKSGDEFRRPWISKRK
jgi:hypothetical protein